MQQPIFLDLETGPLLLPEIEAFKPEFSAPANYKDPEKIKANIQEQEARWLADAALSALTGRILCVGFLIPIGPNSFYSDDSEQSTIEDVLELLKDYIQAGHIVVGFCSRSFDIPFLVRRAYRHGLKVPSCFWEGRYLSSSFIDVAERWACGGREPRDRISLDTLSKFLGTGAKNGKGEDFGKLWATDRPKALEYLQNDLNLCKLAYERLY